MMNKPPRTLFITGFTGTLGKEFVKEILLTTEDRLYLLIRRQNRFSHWDRARKIFLACGLQYLLGTRVHVLEGDVTLPGFGLRPEEIEEIRSKVQEFYHIAALTALNGSEEECNRINTGGTEKALELAWDFLKQGRLERFFYFSTAYVSGSRQTFCAREDELTPEPAHANYYESSKYEAEKKVRLAMAEGMPATIFRPSIVVGNSTTGEVSEFNVIYPFIKLFAHGILTRLPTRLENSFNIVPIDFVIRASLAIAKTKDSIGKTFHLVTEDPPSIGELMKLKEAEYPSSPEIVIVPPEEFKPEALGFESQMVFQMLEPYLGYLNDHLTFETANTRRALEGTGVALPKTDYNFLKTLLKYATDQGYLLV